ncbi:MAG: HWE histidine kinase domain-containing protein [Janthinobacterium lividum]
MAQEWEDTSRLTEAFAALVGSISQIVWLSEEGGQWTWANPSWRAYTGLDDDMSRGRGWIGAIPADEREWAMEAWQNAPSRGVLDLEHGLIHQPSGETRRFHTHGMLLPPRPGRVREWLGTSIEVHGTRQARRQDDLLNTDLRRRILDVIVLVRLVLRQLPKADGSAEEFASRFEGRLDSLARMQAATASRPGATLDLDQIVIEETMLHMAHENGQIQAAGPAIPFLSKAASTFGLVMHELLENSVINGALSRPEGSVAMTWIVDPGDLLRFEWLETGLGARDGSPSHRGLDQKPIERMLADTLGGTASFDVGQNSIRFTVILPLKAGVVRALRE